MVAKVVQTMEADGYKGGLVCMDHVDNEAGCQEIAAAITAKWPEAEIMIMPCGGLCSYYAEAKGIIIGYDWK